MRGNSGHQKEKQGKEKAAGPGRSGGATEDPRICRKANGWGLAGTVRLRLPKQQGYPELVGTLLHDGVKEREVESRLEPGSLALQGPREARSTWQEPGPMTVFRSRAYRHWAASSNPGSSGLRWLGASRPGNGDMRVQA